MIKKELRGIYKAKRMALKPAEISKLEDLMLIQFQQIEIDIPGMIMSYMPYGNANEFDPQLVLDYCYFKNPDQTLFYPVIDVKTKTMTSFVVNDDTVFAKNQYGIDEPIDGIFISPEEIDLVIVPLLGFDVRGNRVGYGKGYYDRFLKECREDIVKIGFSFFEPVPAITDIKRFDVKLDYCITPEDIYRF